MKLSNSFTSNSFTVEPLLTAPPLNKGHLCRNPVPNEQCMHVCTKKNLNKGHPYIMANILFPKGGRYIERSAVHVII